jgi:hypothetical protein
MKKLISYLCAGVLACSAPNLNGIELPERFLNYQSNAKYISTNFVNGEIPIFRILYDLDGDLIADVEEAYFAKYQGESVEIENHPVSYWFNFNGDEIQGIEEAIIDLARDGLNGNEKFYLDLVSKTNL